MNRYELNERISDSMQLERTASVLAAQANQLAAKRNDVNRTLSRRGLPPDRSYDDAICLIKEQIDRLRSEANETWKEVEAACDLDDDGVLNLLNSVVQRAAMDLELSLSGRGFADTVKEVRQFFLNDADVYTRADVRGVPDRIYEGHKRFQKYVRDNIDGILEDTERNRRARKDMTDNKYRCPLCGGGLFVYGRSDRNRYMVRCTGCSLSETVMTCKKE